MSSKPALHSDRSPDLSQRQGLFDWWVARRVIITPTVLVLAVLGVLLSPLLFTGAAVLDLLSGKRKMPRVRLVYLIIGGLLIESGGILGSFGLWFATGFGFVGSRQWRWHQHRAILGWYTSTVLNHIVRALGTTIDWRDNADLSTGPVVLAARHTSFFDALIPGAVLSRRNQLLAHHTLTKGLRYAPCIDIVGKRFPQRFIDRAPARDGNEIEPIREIGALLNERSSAVIFPEGTFRNPKRFARIIERLAEREPHLVDRASKLRHVLPPKPSGTKALLDGAPEADLVICANTGFEPFGTIKEIVTYPVASRPIVIETWRIPRNEIPEDPDEFDLWLLAQYEAMDDWVEAQLAAY